MFEFLQFIRSRQDFLFQLTLNSFLVIIIFLCAEAGRLMGIVGGPLAISPVWPATGVSLAALLLFGFKASPGVFLGNFCYNTIHFLLESQQILSPVLAGIAISAGSLIQGLVGTYVIRRFSFKGYFKSVRDVMVFLIGGGVVTCVIASSTGVATLYMYGTVPFERISDVWLTFWLGDCFGIYMITPFLIVWSIYKPIGRIAGHSKRETVLMILSFFAITWISFIKTCPVGDLFILLGVWIAYRSSLHGTVLSTIFMSFAATIPTSIGYGSVTAYFSASPWLALIVFLEIMITTSLIVSAIINEFQLSLTLLQVQNNDLQQNMNAYKNTLKQLGIKVTFSVRQKPKE